MNCVKVHSLLRLGFKMDVLFTAELLLPDRGNVFYAMRKDVIDVRCVVRRRSEQKHRRKKSKHRTRRISRLIF